jgi:hypothetical protein
MRTFSKALIIGLLVELTVGVSAYAIAAYTMTSNTVTLNVVPASTPTPSPTPPAASPQATLTLRWDVFGGVAAGSNTIGDNEAVTLVAYVSDNTEGITVNFYEGSASGSLLGSAVTGSDGAAVLRIGTLSAGTHSFIATANHP